MLTHGEAGEVIFFHFWTMHHDILVTSIHPWRLTRNMSSWRFGRSFSFLNGELVGSMLIFQGVKILISSVVIKKKSPHRSVIPFFLNRSVIPFPGIPKGGALIRSQTKPNQKEGQQKEKGSIWVLPKIVVPQNGWFMMETPIKMDDLGVPLFRKHPYAYNIHSIKSKAVFWAEHVFPWRQKIQNRRHPGVLGLIERNVDLHFSISLLPCVGQPLLGFACSMLGKKSKNYQLSQIWWSNGDLPW